MESGDDIGDDAEFILWEVSERLQKLRLNEAKYSLGFLKAEPTSWFPSLGKRWIELFHATSIDVQVVGSSTQLDFPEGLFRVTPVEVDGETCALGFDENSYRAIVDAISPGCRDRAADVVFEYIERRLVATLAKSWSGETPLQCYYLSLAMSDAIEIVGTAHLILDISGVQVNIYFGLGPALVEKLDLLSRQKMGKGKSTEARGELKRVSVGISELSVSPAVLIDYLRPDAIIDLETLVSPYVTVKIDDKPWSSGELHELNGKFAVKFRDIGPVSLEPISGTTRVWIELAHVELEGDLIGEYSREGAILVTEIPATNTALIFINGEEVGKGVLGEIDGSFALHVLPK